MTSQTIPLCACGCGLETRVPTKNRHDRGERKGVPLPYRAGHVPRLLRDPLARFWTHVAKSDGCWLWTGTKTSGRWDYPKFFIELTPSGSRYALAHRWIYERLVGPIPDGYTVDHVKARGCTSTLCVRPDHLEAVTNVENVMRGDGACVRNAAKTHCRNNHPFDLLNTVVYYDRRGRAKRVCRTCQRANSRKRRAA